MSSSNCNVLNRELSSSSTSHTRFSFEGEVTSPEQLHYSLGKTIGSGTYAKVKASWSPYERKMIAIKIMEKRGASKEVLTKFLPRELDVVQRLHHPNILRVYQLVDTPRQVYFMMEMAQNGDLLDYINTSRVLPEPEARFVMRSIAAGIAHCHAKDIVHRDLKCENIMITKNMEVKIGDFGFARQVGDGHTDVTTPCGSFSYAAPELLSGRHGSVYDGKKVDIWSMGCILYAMVCGCLPFGDDTQVAQMISKPLSFPGPISRDCRHILANGMLNCDSKRRCDITQLRISPWMRSTVRPLTPYRYTKYVPEECLLKPLPCIPAPIHNAGSSSVSVYAHPRPVCSVTQPSRLSQATQITATKRQHSVGRSKENRQPKTVIDQKNGEQTTTRPAISRSVRGKISSAGRKLVKTILHRSSPPRTIVESNV